MSSAPRKPHEDDSLMGRFDRYGLRRFRAREGVYAVLLAAALLVLTQGTSIRKAGDELKPGIGRTLILAVGDPAGWIAERLPLASATSRATALVSPNQSLGNEGGFSSRPTSASATEVPPVTPEAFEPSTLGVKAPRKRLRTLLVTGDSMSTPLDSDLAERLGPDGVHVIQDPHLGSGISNTFIVDWGKLAAFQVRHDRPEAVVIFIGANDGYPMTAPTGATVECCNAEWASIYANRVRQMANTYRQGGAARVYWITLPTPREAERQAIARAVNAAIEVGVQPWADQIRVIDTVPVFTPGGVYRDAMNVNGTQTIVREADGIHLNEAGSSLLAGIVVARMDEDFSY
jgi:hypothetical protein